MYEEPRLTDEAAHSVYFSATKKHMATSHERSMAKTTHSTASRRHEMISRRCNLAYEPPGLLPPEEFHRCSI
eukprot:scaffold96700_cov35-Tisochrysis_lutea.AAC.1